MSEIDPPKGASATTHSHADVLSIVSHDIRAPLGVILGSIGELLNPKVGPLTDEQRGLVLLIRRSGERLSRLAANVLYLNRVASGRADPSVQRVDLRVVARRAIETFERAGELARVRVDVDAPSGAGEVDAEVDPELTVQALVNVLANAVRFARAQVKVTLEKSGDVTRLVVDDDGPGFDPAVLARSFDGGAAGALAEATSSPEGGRRAAPSGLGLGVARAILRSQGGSIGGASRLDSAGRAVGARVVFTFSRAV